MFRRERIALAATACAVGLLIATPAVHAGRSVVVLDFAGKRADGLHETIVELLRDRGYKVISDRRYKKTARRLRARRMSRRDVSKVARRLHADAVIQGELVRDYDDRYELKLGVRAGADGRVVKRFTIRVKRRRLSGRSERKLGRRLDVIVGDLPRAGGSRRVASHDRRASNRDRRSRRSADKRRRRSKARRQALAADRRAERLLEKRRAKRRRRAASKNRRRDREEAAADRRRDRAEARQRRRERAEEERERQAESERDKHRRAAERAERRRLAKARKARRERARVKKLMTEEIDNDGNVVDNETPPGL